VQLGICTSSDACVDEGELLLRWNVQYAWIRHEMMVTSLTKLGWSIVQGYNQRVSLTER
jgi:hypothetical protein